MSFMLIWRLIKNAYTPTLLPRVESIQFACMPTVSCTACYAAVPGGNAFISIIFIISRLIIAFHYNMKSNVLIIGRTQSNEKVKLWSKGFSVTAVRMINGVSVLKAAESSTPCSHPFSFLCHQYTAKQIPVFLLRHEAKHLLADP